VRPRAQARHLGWAIALGGGNRGFIGRYWQFGGPAPESPYVVKLFATRREARAAMRYVKPKGGYHAYPDARVTQVSVTIEAFP
jgi:hypothetical protein